MLFFKEKFSGRAFNYGNEFVEFIHFLLEKFEKSADEAENFGVTFLVLSLIVIQLRDKNIFFKNVQRR